jgi:hypothetical protein
MTLGVEDVQKLVRHELSTATRLGYTALAVISLGVTGVVTSLLMTEPFLPFRTQAAFAVIALGGLAWAGLAIWVLTRRRVLLAQHRVTASTLAVALAAVFLAGAIALRERAGMLAVLFNGAMLIVALIWAARARRWMAALNERRRALDAGERR